MPNDSTSRPSRRAPLAGIARWLTLRRQQRKRAALERETCRLLMALSERELWDLGLRRGDLALMAERQR